MHTNGLTAKKLDTKVLLSTLWIVVMILLSRALKYRGNRWVNIIASLLTIAFVVGGGASYPHYIFIVTVEVICLLLIIWFAWKWTESSA